MNVRGWMSDVSRNVRHRRRRRGRHLIFSSARISLEKDFSFAPETGGRDAIAAGPNRTPHTYAVAGSNSNVVYISFS